MRFIPAVAALQSRPVRFIADEQANARPVKPLYRALRCMGVDFDYEGDAQYPVTIQGPATVSGPVKLDSSGSSQFLSALLLVAPLLDADSDYVEIELTGSLPSKPHIEMTIEALRARGVEVQWTLKRRYESSGRPHPATKSSNRPSNAGLLAPQS